MSDYSKFVSFVSDICTFLFGNLDMRGDAMCQLMIIWLMSVLKRQGHAIKNKYMLDNPSTASVRHIVNNSVEKPYFNETSHEQKKLMAYLPKLKKEVPRDDSLKERELKFQHITAFIRSERIVYTEDIEFLTNIKKMCLLTRNDVFKIDQKLISNIAWRNFDPMQRKNGLDLKFWVILSLFASVIILFIGYSRISPEPVWFWQSFVEDDLKDNLWTHAMIFLTFGSFQLFFLSAKSVDKVGLNSKPLFFDYIDQAILAKKKETIF